MGFIYKFLMADDSHEMSRLIFSENEERKQTACRSRLLQILLIALRVN